MEEGLWRGGGGGAQQNTRALLPSTGKSVTQCELFTDDWSALLKLLQLLLSFKAKVEREEERKSERVGVRERERQTERMSEKGGGRE